MTTLFADPEPGEVRLIEGVLCRWEPGDPEDPFDTPRWQPVEGGPGTPNHKPGTSDDDTYKLIKARKAEFQRRTIEIYRAEGYDIYSVQTTSISGWGSDRVVHSHDLYGLFDYEAWKPGETIGVQITSRSHLGDHLTKMCSHVPASSKDKTWRGTYLRKWLEAGRRAVLIGFYKDGRLWAYERREITLAIMDQHEPGRRFKTMQRKAV